MICKIISIMSLVIEHVVMTYRVLFKDTGILDRRGRCVFLRTLSSVRLFGRSYAY